MCESGQKGEEGQSGKGFRRETWAEEVTRLQREIAEGEEP